MLPKVLGLVCVALTVAVVFFFGGQQKDSVAQDNHWEAPAATAVQSPALSADVQEMVALGQQAIGGLNAELDRLVQAVEQGEAVRNGAVQDLSNRVNEVLEKVSSNSLSKEDVVHLVTTTVDEKTAAVKAECLCDCDCDAKLAEVNQQIEALKARVAELEKPKVASYQSSAYGASTTVSGVASGGSTGSLPSVSAAPVQSNLSYQQSATSTFQQSYQQPVFQQPAASSCVQNADGTWTCNSQGSQGVASRGLGARLRAVRGR